MNTFNVSNAQPHNEVGKAPLSQNLPASLGLAVVNNEVDNNFIASLQRVFTFTFILIFALISGVFAGVNPYGSAQVVSQLTKSNVAKAANVVASPARTMAPKGKFPLEKGMTILSRLSNPNALYPGLGSNVNGFSLEVHDMRQPYLNGAQPATGYLAENWTAGTKSVYSHEQWTNANLGEIFGIEIDNSVSKNPNVFVGSTGCLVGFRDNLANYSGSVLPRTGSRGGDMFRLDGLTGNVTLLTDKIPSKTYPANMVDTEANRYTGLGNIGYNYSKKLLYTVSIDNGLIYTVDAEKGGLVGSPFDHNKSVLDRTTYAMSDIRRLAIGMAWNPADNRLYFSRVSADGYTTVATTSYIFDKSEIFSIGLNPDGTINAAEEPRSEIKIVATAASGSQLGLVTDIEFTSDGNRMILSELTINNFKLNDNSQFRKGSHSAASFSLERNGVKGSWSIGETYRVGNFNRFLNAAGGADFGYDHSKNEGVYADAVVSIGDFLSNYIYGLMISPMNQGNYPDSNPFPHYAMQANIAHFGTEVEKTGLGDVDVFSGVEYADDLKIKITVTKNPSSCEASDGSISFNGTGTGTEDGKGLHPNTPYPVSYRRNGGEIVKVTLVTDENGVITIPNLPDGDYTEIKIDDNPSYVSNELDAKLVCPVKLMLSGNVFHDANGLNPSPSNTVDGKPIAAPDGDPLYANLFTANGVFIASTPIGTDGKYQFTSQITANTEYIVAIGTVEGNSGSTPASVTKLPTDWVNTGENVGRTQGSDGKVDGILKAKVEEVSRPEVNFGIEHLPDSDNKIGKLKVSPKKDEYIPLNGTIDNAQHLTGKDPEDQPNSNSLLSKSVGITSLPTNGELWYNGTKITVGRDGINPVSNDNPFVINSLDPTSLFIKFTGSGYKDTQFTYAYIDLAGKIDPTPATYVLYWDSALPVKLTKFSGVLQESTVKLTWSTVSESKSEYFGIEHSADGKTWDALGKVKSTGESEVLQNYEFIHNSPRSGANLYRLNMVDIDGSNSYSRIISVNYKGDATVAVFPNPVSNVLKVKVSSWESVKAVNVFSTSGKQILTTGAKPEVEIDVTSFAEGMYIVTIDNKDGSRSSHKVMVVR